MRSNFSTFDPSGTIDIISPAGAEYGLTDVIANGCGWGLVFLFMRHINDSFYSSFPKYLLLLMCALFMQTSLAPGFIVISFK